MHPKFRNHFPAKCWGSMHWTRGLGCRNRRMGIYFLIRKKVTFEFSQYKSLPPNVLWPPPLLLQADFRETKASPARSCLQRPPLLCPGLLLAALMDGAGSLQAESEQSKSGVLDQLQGGCRSRSRTEGSHSSLCCCDPHLPAFARFRAATWLPGRQPWARAGLPGGSCNSALTGPHPAAGLANENSHGKVGRIRARSAGETSSAIPLTPPSSVVHAPRI